MQTIDSARLRVTLHKLNVISRLSSGRFARNRFDFGQEFIYWRCNPVRQPINSIQFDEFQARFLTSLSATTDLPHPVTTIKTMRLYGNEFRDRI